MAELIPTDQCSHETQMAYLVDRYQGWRKYECPYCEIQRLRRDLEIQAVNATAVLQAQHERDCAVERVAAARQIVAAHITLLRFVLALKEAAAAAPEIRLGAQQELAQAEAWFTQPDDVPDTTSTTGE